MNFSSLGTTLIEIIEARAKETPDKTAYIFLRDGNIDEESITYSGLAAHAKAVAKKLLTVAQPGDCALINHNPGIPYITSFLGCLYAGVAAVPVYPPRLNQKMDRLLSIMEDVKPKACLTSDSVMDTLAPLFENTPALNKCSWIRTDSLTADGISEIPEASFNPETLAFIQYTSGSTSQPKGVMLSHGNLIANLECIAKCCNASQESKGVIWLPPYHDMGLIGGILVPLYSGFPVVLMSPFAFLQRPHRWLQAISRYKATMSSAPNFAYDLCVQRVQDKHLEGVDLSSWSVAFCGAEPIHAEVLESFTNRFQSVGFRKETFYPCYGMAESTLILTGGDRKAPPHLLSVDRAIFENDGRIEFSSPGKNAKTFVGCGSPFPGHRVLIVDPATKVRCPDGVVGEIWFQGPSAAVGYWAKPSVTEQVFHARPIGEEGEPGFLRTGDLGFVWHGELYVTGRIKDLLILRGKNYYPQDIERSVEQCHPLLKKGACAAFSVEGNSGEQLVVIQEVARQAQQAEYEPLLRLIQERVLEEHGISAYAISLIRANSIPLTSSGKIQRHASRKMFLDNQLQELKRLTLTA